MQAYGPGQEGVVGSHSSRAARSGVGTPVGTRDFHLSKSVMTGPEAHPGSCTLDTVALWGWGGGKAARKWS